MIDPITVAGGTVGGLVGAGLLNGPMQTLQDVWQICFNRWTDNWLEKQKIIQEQNLVEFKERIEYKAQQIPPEHIQELDISIIGPALEASRFYIGEPDIRELFTNLIAASMNQAHNEQVHHAFVELIKMLSPKDAKLLNYLHTSGDESIVRAQLYLFQLTCFGASLYPLTPPTLLYQIGLDGSLKAFIACACYIAFLVTDSMLRFVILGW